MADDDGIRLRNVSTYGDLDVPDLGLIVEFHHEVVVADEALAGRLIDSGHFTAVNRPGPKTGQPTPASIGGDGRTDPSVPTGPEATTTPDATTGAGTDSGENDQ